MLLVYYIIKGFQKGGNIVSSKNITISDIAKKAGVSISTVSRVLNNSELVSKKTKIKVQKIMDELNYIPNEMARGLIKKNSKAIALIIPDILNPYYSELIKGVENVVNKQGYSMFLCNTNYNHNKEKAYILEMVERRVDGIIIISTFLQDQEFINNLKDRIKIVTIQTFIDGIDNISTNDEKGMTEALEHLIKLGHKKIAFICIDIRNCSNRYKAYKDTLEKNGIPFRKEYVKEYLADNVNVDMFKDSIGYKMTKQLLELKDPPTAIQTLNDYLAYGAYIAIKEKNLRIPDDISVIGFDDIIVSKIIDPPLTTVQQPIYDMGETGGELLLSNIIEGPKTVRREIILPTKLIIRKSTASPRKNIY